MIAGAPAPTGRDLPACHHDPAVSASRERANQEFLKEGSPFSANYRWSSKRLILSPEDIYLQRTIQINQHNL